MFFIIMPFFITIAFLIIGLLLRRWQLRRRKQARIHQLRTWIAQNQALDPVLQQWVQFLPPNEAELLLDLLNGYCTSLKWKLDWLFAPQLEKAPVLKSVLEESISAYTRAILLSLQLEEDVRAYEVYLAFEKSPTRKQRVIVQRLYARINSENLIPPNQQFLRRFVSRSMTYREQVAAIQHSFDRDPASAMAALKAVLTSEALVTASQGNQELSPPAITLPAGVTA